MPHYPTGTSFSPLPGLIIVGTDTAVGKTLTTGLLIRGLQQRGFRPGVMKPIETGVPNSQEGQSDAERLQALLPEPDSLSYISPYRFPAPLSPLVSARLAGQTIEISTILSAYRALTSQHDCMLIEGIGGVMVPLTLKQDFRDLIGALALPCLIVARAALGAVNHTLLTIRALEEQHIPIMGIVFNTPLEANPSPNVSLQAASTVEQIKELTTIPVFGRVEFYKDLSQKWERGFEKCLQDSAVSELIQQVAKRIVEIA